MNNPFRYSPSPIIQELASKLIAQIDSSSELNSLFSEGKMLGILRVEDRNAKEVKKENIDAPLVHQYNSHSYLIAFSGNVAGQNLISGFVPPIYDLLDTEGYFKEEEMQISALNFKIDEYKNGEELIKLRAELDEIQKKKEDEIQTLKAQHTRNKAERARLRESYAKNELSITESNDLDVENEILGRLIKESQFEKAEIKRRSRYYDSRIKEIETRIETSNIEIVRLSNERLVRSKALQKWIFEQYRVKNSSGIEQDIYSIFSKVGLIPPAGTGECAGPKLLNYAYNQGLRTIELAEFWYGKESVSQIRTHGCFYPACTSKCAPLLGFMLKGLDIEDDFPIEDKPKIIYEDEDIIIVSKPSGMPSIPGKVNRVSLLEFLEKQYNQTIYPIHRLDMDTSGIMLYGKNQSSQYIISKQFEDRIIKKTYIAKLSRPISKQEGLINLPLRPDYENRPRQMVDFSSGKEAITEFSLINNQLIRFYPKTGRTHQLRVHAAHTLGLNAPIIGDKLYGGSEGKYMREDGDNQEGSEGKQLERSENNQKHDRLELYAESIGFYHPRTKKWETFRIDTIITSTYNFKAKQFLEVP